MPVDKFPKSEATSIDELACPDCLERSVTTVDHIADGIDSERKKATHAAYCENCDERISPPEIKRQIDDAEFASGTTVDIGNPLNSLQKLGRLNGKIVVTVLLLITAGLVMTIGLPGSGSQGTAQASPEIGQIQKADVSISEYSAAGNWTIYGANGEYVISAERNGSVVYLADDAAISTQATYYDSVADARRVAEIWADRESNPDLITQTEAINQTAFQVFEINDAYVVAAEVNGTIQYLSPGPGISEEPYFYESEDEATRVLLNWATIRYGLDIEGISAEQNIESTDLSASELAAPLSEISTVELQADLLEWDVPVEFDTWTYDDWVVIGTNSSYYAVGVNEEGLAFLNSDATLSTEPYAFDTLEAAEEAINQTNATIDPIDADARETIAATLLPSLTNDDITVGGSGGGGSGGSGGTADVGTPEDDNLNVNESVVSSTSPGAMNGKVLDSDGEPISEAKVVMYSDPKAVTTGSDGTYTISNISTGIHDLIVVSKTESGLAYTENTTVRVEDNGDIRVIEAPSYAQYLTDSDGHVQSDTVNMVVPDAKAIRLAGQGTNMTGTMSLSQPKNAETATVRLKPVETKAKKSAEFTGSDLSKIHYIDGNAQPEAQLVRLNGNVVWKHTNQSGQASEEITVTPDGNAGMSNMSIRMSGQNQSERVTLATGGQTGQYPFTMGGNERGQNFSFHATGKVKTSDQVNDEITLKSGDTTPYTARGNIETTAELTLHGETVKTQDQFSQNGISTSESANSVSFEGTRIEDASVTVSSGPASQTQVTAIDSFEGFDYDGVYLEWVTWTAPSDGTYYIPSNIRDGDWYIEGSVYHDASLARPKRSGELKLQTIRDGEVSTIDTGSIACGRESYHSQSHCNSNGADTGDTSQAPDIGGVTVELEKGDKLKFSDDGAGGFWFDSDYPIYRLNTLDETTVTLESGSETKSKTVNIGANESQTVQFGSLPTEDTTVSVNGESAPETWQYTIEGTGVSVVENPEVDTDRDGEADLDYQGKLPSGDSITRKVQLKPGTRQIELSQSGPTTATVDISYTPRSTTEGLTVDVNNDGEPEAKIDRRLMPGEQATLSIDPLKPGSYEMDVSTRKGGVQYEMNATKRTVTRSPQLSISGREVCSQSGEFGGSVTCDIPPSAYGDTAVMDVSTEVGKINYTVMYDAGYVPASGTVAVNGQTYRYPEDFNTTGPLTGSAAVSTNVTELSTGGNEIAIQTDDVQGVETNLTATLSYAGERTKTENVAITVINSNGVSHSKSVPEEAIDSAGFLKKTVSLNLNASWFSSGKNRVRVNTAGQSSVEAVITAEATDSQRKRLDRSVNRTAS